MTTWTTKDGDTLKIADMETSHIENCIAHLKKKMPTQEEDEVISADFPESMSHIRSHYTEPGAKTYRRKIAEFEKELSRRKSKLK